MGYYQFKFSFRLRQQGPVSGIWVPVIVIRLGYRLFHLLLLHLGPLRPPYVSSVAVSSWAALVVLGDHLFHHWQPSVSSGAVVFFVGTLSLWSLAPFLFRDGAAFPVIVGCHPAHLGPPSVWLGCASSPIAP